MVRLALVLLLFLSTTAHAQVRGRIIDARAGDGIGGAHVQLAGRTLERLAVTAGDGAYAFAGLPSGEYRLVIVHPGYDSASVRVVLGAGRDVMLDVPLTLRPFPVDRILVAGERGASGAGANGDSTTAGDSLANVLNGRRAAALGPQSASALADMVAADMTREPPADPGGGRKPHVLYIWGSSAERGRVLLDGASLNAPLHLGALLPPIDPDMLAGAELRSGGISPRFDGGTTYIMDFTSRPAAEAMHRAWGEVDFLTGRLGVSAPIGRDGGFTVGARRVNDEVIDRLLGRPFGYGYADALARMDAGLGSAGRVQGTLLVTRETIGIPRDLDRDEAGWRNIATALAWSDDGGAAARNTVRATFSRGIADLPLLSAPGGHVEATMDRFTTTAERRWNRGGTGGVFGVEYEHLRFDRRGSADSDPALPPPNGPVTCTESLPCFAVAADAISSFAEAAWQPQRTVSARVGARLRYDPGRGGVDLLPRASLTSLVGDATVVTFSAGRFSQTYAAVPGDDLDVTLAGTGRVDNAHAAVAHANHVELNVTHRGRHAALAGSVYLRHHESSDEAAGRVTPGLDVSWGYVGDIASVTLGYSLVANRTTVADGSRAFHQLAGVGFGARRGPMYFSASTAYGHGMPLTSIVLERPSQAASPPWGAEEYTNSAAGRADGIAGVPARGYVRVDAAIGAEWRLRWSGRELSVVPYGRIVNAFSQREALFYYHEAGSPGEPRPLGALPAIPVVGVRWHF